MQLSLIISDQVAFRSQYDYGKQSMITRKKNYVHRKGTEVLLFESWNIRSSAHV